jgi:hypothetical protein
MELGRTSRTAIKLWFKTGGIQRLFPLDKFVVARKMHQNLE